MYMGASYARDPAVSSLESAMNELTAPIAINYITGLGVCMNTMSNMVDYMLLE